MAKKITQVVDAQALEGQTVFTNGCFDLMHVGHLRYLQQARALGDRLIIGLNSDKSVQTIKGPDRPILPEDERAELLLGLDCVDGVVLFDEPTASRLISEIRPHIYAKGGDYNPESLPEAPVVKEYGGRIVILPFVEGRSTTSIIEKIRRISE